MSMLKKTIMLMWKHPKSIHKPAAMYGNFWIPSKYDNEEILASTKDPYPIKL